MKSLLALFAVTAVLGVAAIAAPASAADAKIVMKCDWTQSREDQKDCVCLAEARESKWVDGRLVWLTSYRPAICPANGGGGGGSSSSDEPSKPHKKHQKTVSKAESFSKVESTAFLFFGSPVAETEQKEHTTAFTTGPGGAAGADAGSTGSAIAGSSGGLSGGLSLGSTSGGSCVGTGC